MTAELGVVTTGPATPISSSSKATSGEGQGSFPAHPCCPPWAVSSPRGQLPSLQLALPPSSCFLAAVPVPNWFSSLVCRTQPRSGSTAEVTLVGAGRDEGARLSPAVQSHPPLCCRSLHEAQILQGTGVLQEGRDPCPGRGAHPCLPGRHRVPGYSPCSLSPSFPMATAQQTQTQLLADPPVPALSPPRSWSCALRPPLPPVKIYLDYHYLFCKQPLKLVPLKRVCDGQLDCLQGEDEANCPQWVPEGPPAGGECRTPL